MRQAVLLSLLIALFGGQVFAQTEAEEFAGVWQSIGYGMVFEITEETVNVYEVTAVSCVPLLDVPSIIYEGDSVILKDATIVGLGLFMGREDFPVTLEADGLLHLDIPGKLNDILAERVDALPAVCAELTPDTPTHNFETFWNFFNENYAFFDLHGVDWQALYDEYRPQISDDMTDEALFNVLSEMITPLEDAHTSLISISLGEQYNPSKTPVWAEDLTEEAVERVFRLPVGDALIDEPTFLANDLIAYGHLSEAVGYINILGMSGYSAEGDDAAVLSAAMDEVLNAFQDLDAIVIDIRFNGGGEDQHSLHIAGRFTDEPVLAFSKSVWHEGEFYPLLESNIEPTGDEAYTGDVYLLTSSLSVSAAETFAIAMNQLPNVTLVGEPTTGALSDMWFMILPNGWIGTLSNERYLDPAGVLYEGIGVPPDVEVPMTAEMFETGIDPFVDVVLGLAQ